MILWFLIITFLSHIIPYKPAVFIARRIADFMYFTFFRNRRKFVFENFKIIKNRNLSNYELRRYAIETFENFATFVYEFLILPSVYIKGFQNYITPINIERMTKPSLFLTGHLGNWEWGASMVSLFGFNITVIALGHQQKTLKNFFTRRRNQAGMNVVYIDSDLKDIFRTLKKGNVIATLGDRDYTGNSIYVNFLGKKIPIPKGVFQISLRLKIPIIPTFCVKENNKYRLYFEEPIYFKTENEVVEKWVNILERYVKKYPTQWYIFDNIWKE